LSRGKNKWEREEGDFQNVKEPCHGQIYDRSIVNSSSLFYILSKTTSNGVESGRFPAIGCSGVDRRRWKKKGKSSGSCFQGMLVVGRDFIGREGFHDGQWEGEENRGDLYGDWWYGCWSELCGVLIVR
ncbi:hypothetical protein HAX54_048660, partial [Datura stramonium]|nr:hypothetical protein [Datura stramonium]